MFYRWAKMEGEWEIVCFENEKDMEEGCFRIFFADESFHASDFENIGFEWGEWVRLPAGYENRPRASDIM